MKTLRIWWWVAIGSLIACGGGGDTGKIAAPPIVSTVSVTLARSPIAVGSITTANVVARDAQGASIAGRAVTWNSSNLSVAVVDGSGTITALAEGTAFIAATVDGVKGVALLTVTRAPVASITVTLGATSVRSNDSTFAIATLYGSNGQTLTDRHIEWRSDNSAVATITGSGMIMALSPGLSTITAVCEGISAGSLLTVTPDQVASVVVRVNKNSLLPYETAQASATLADRHGNLLDDRNISWLSSKTDVATISTTGQILAIAPGTTTITAVSEGVSGSSIIDVTFAEVASVTVTPSHVTMVPVQSMRLIATVRDNRQNVLTNRSLTWTSSNDLVAVVGTDGTVITIAPGTAQITATSDGIAGSANITVTLVGIATLTLSPTSIVMTAGETRTMVVTARDTAGNVLNNRHITWSSSNSSVANGFAYGDTLVVTGLQAGTSLITAQSGGQQVTAPVTISAPSVNVCALIAGAAVYGSDGTYLGRFTNRFDFESVLNTVGPYGSSYGAFSTNNISGTYGSAYGNLSARNPLANSPPLVVKDGSVYAFYTANATKLPRVAPAFALTCNFP